jgi:hypothetical protein
MKCAWFHFARVLKSTFTRVLLMTSQVSRGIFSIEWLGGSEYDEGYDKVDRGVLLINYT